MHRALCWSLPWEPTVGRKASDGRLLVLRVRGEVLLRQAVRPMVQRLLQGSGFRVQGSGFRVQVPGSGLGVQGWKFRVQGSGFEVQVMGV